MNSTLKEHLFAENKTGDSSTDLWKFEMTRTIAVLYNSGGGILRVGVEDDGNVSGVKKAQDYATDKSELANTLHHYLDLVPPFETVEKDGYVEISVREGVLFPSILRTELERPPDPRRPGDSPKKYPLGTVFVRRMNGRQPSSEPPQTRSDWQTALHDWESNRGVSVQGPLLAQFCLVINEWNPFAHGGNTEVTIWKAHCIADAAGMMGRSKLRDGLKKIIQKMKSSPAQPQVNEDRNQAGANYKKSICDEVEQLCHELGLAVETPLGR
jgi:hypothetical protein